MFIFIFIFIFMVFVSIDLIGLVAFIMKDKIALYGRQRSHNFCPANQHRPKAKSIQQIGLQLTVHGPDWHFKSNTVHVDQFKNCSLIRRRKGLFVCCKSFC